MRTGPRSVLVTAGSPAPPNTGCHQVETQGGSEPVNRMTELGCRQVLPRPPRVAGQLGVGLADTGGIGHPAQPLPGHCQHRPHHYRPGGLLGLQVCRVSTSTSPLPAPALGASSDQPSPLLPG